VPASCLQKVARRIAEIHETFNLVPGPDLTRGNAVRANVVAHRRHILGAVSEPVVWILGGESGPSAIGFLQLHHDIGDLQPLRLISEGRRPHHVNPELAGRRQVADRETHVVYAPGEIQGA
jgi:hypothetical protein